MTAVSGAKKVPNTPKVHITDVKINKWHIRIKWTLRGVFALIAAYYALGIAYSVGLMAYLDSLAISILPHYVGYAGMGAAMPWFQWYSAWAVRGLFAIGGALLYDCIAKFATITNNCVKKAAPKFNRPKMPQAEPIKV